MSILIARRPAIKDVTDKALENPTALVDSEPLTVQTARMHIRAQKRRRRAFTLVELLAVLAVIAILLSIVLPAVQSARESARRVQCQNNLRQIGLALLNFESVHKAFPASGWTKPGIGNAAGSYLSWRVVCLDFTEQSSISSIYARSENWWHTSNLAAGVHGVPTFLCPSTPRHPPAHMAIAKAPRPALTLAQPLATADYEAVMGIRASINSSRYNAQNRFSVLFRDSRTRFAEIVDGSSNTTMVVESAARPWVYRRGQLRTEIPNDQGIGWIDSESAYTLDGASLDGAREGCGLDFGCSAGVNARNDNEPYGFHIGGVYSLQADGHVTFVSQEVALPILAALCTRAAAD